MDSATEKHHAHELIERLPDSQLPTAIRFLEFMLLDPVARALATAPPDDEPVTDQDRSRFHAGQAWFAQRGGKGISKEEILAGDERENEGCHLRLSERDSLRVVDLVENPPAPNTKLIAAARKFSKISPPTPASTA